MPVRSHYVPASHLRRFTSSLEDSHLWVFDKETERFFPTSPEKAAREYGFYSDEDERSLEKIVETPVSPILNKLHQSQSLDTEERALLSLYMATFLMRVPERRRRALAVAPDVVDQTVDRLVREIQQLADKQCLNSDLALQRILEAEKARSKLKRELPEEVLEQVRSPWPSSQLVQAVFRMKWRFARTNGPIFFLTTDNPVFFFDAYGLGTSKSELSFPVSSQIAVVASNTMAKDGLFVEARQSLVKEVNRRLVSAATRFIFYHQEASWIKRIALKKHPYLSRIVWD